MSLVFSLSDGVTAISLVPEWDFKDKLTMRRSTMRTLDQNLFSYKWAVFDSFEVGLSMVPAADAAQINAWWRAGASLTLTITRDGETRSATAKITGTTQPFISYHSPQVDYYKGKIALEATAPWS